ncbi:MAG: DUF4249 family protein, partial [Bacteroidales bacterium]|nr:DUF4249 family protein [Bacteroidales bacterium]
GLPKIIDDALVLLYEDDNLADTLVYTENGLYVSEIIAKIGSAYRVEVFCKGHKTCCAYDTVPDFPVLSGCIFSDSALIDKDGYYISKAELSINNIGTKTGYYEIKMYARYFDGLGIENLSTLYFSQLNNSDPVILESGVSYLDNTVLIFSNNLFLNESYILPIYYQDYNNQAGKYYSNYDLIVSMWAISPNYYKYKCSEIIQNYNGSGLFTPGNNLSAMPVSNYSNVENGFGIFAAYSTTTDTFPKQ